MITLHLPSFLPSFDQVNCVEMERASITVSRIREDTRGNPVVSRTIYCILHGRSAKNCTLDKLQIYYSNQPVYRRRWLHPSWYQTSDSFQICCVIGVTFESSWNGQHKFLSQPRSRCWVNGARLLCPTSKSLWSSDLAHTTLAVNTCRHSSSV